MSLSYRSHLLCRVDHSASGSAVTPCTPYCPGVSGFPELECNGCQSLFHSKCAGIAPNRVAMIKRSFRCKVRSRNSRSQIDMRNII